MYAYIVAGVLIIYKQNKNMKKIITREHIASLFTTRDNGDDTERIVYSDVYLFAQDNSVEKDVYELVSDIAYNSGLSHGFSYEIMSRACDVLADLPVWQGDDIDSDDGLHEAIDAIVPVYNDDLLKIANVHDHHLIDETLQSNGLNSIIEACQMAWYDAINDATRAIYEAVVDYNNANSQ